MIIKTKDLPNVLSYFKPLGFIGKCMSLIKSKELFVCLDNFTGIYIPRRINEIIKEIYHPDVKECKNLLDLLTVVCKDVYESSFNKKDDTILLSLGTCKCIFSISDGVVTFITYNITMNESIVDLWVKIYENELVTELVATHLAYLGLKVKRGNSAVIMRGLKNNEDNMDWYNRWVKFKNKESNEDEGLFTYRNYRLIFPDLEVVDEESCFKFFNEVKTVEVN